MAERSDTTSETPRRNLVYYVLLTLLVAVLVLFMGAGLAFGCRMPEADREE